MFDNRKEPHDKLPGAGERDEGTPGPASDPAEMSDGDLDAEVRALWAQVHVAMGRAVALQAEINKRELWGTWGAKSPAAWLSWRTGISVPEAARVCRVADHHDDRVASTRALAAGELSLAKADAITKVATDATEDTLLYYARHAPTVELESIARAYRSATSDDDPGQRHSRRYLTTYFDNNSNWIIRGRLEPHAGAIVERALRVAEDDLPPNPEADGRGFKADALVAVADAALAAQDTSPGGTPDRFQIVVHTSEDVVKNGLCEVEPGVLLSPATARRLACDAALVDLVEQDGIPRSMGTKTRSVSTRLRRALEARDRTCRWPGCTAPGRYDAHHIVFRRDGGRNQLDNLVLLCRFHHRAVHEGGFTVTATAAGLKFTSPYGWDVSPVPKAPRRFADLTEAVRHIGVDPDPERCLPAQFVGETDVAVCVDHLLDDDQVAARASPSPT